VGLRTDVADGEQDVEVSHDVVGLGVRRMPSVDHRVRGGRLLAVVDDRVGSNVPDHGFDEGVVGQVPDGQLDVQPADLAPGADPLMQCRDREERTDAELQLPLPLGEVVDHSDAMPRLREGHGRRPAEVTVAAQDEDPLGQFTVSKLSLGAGVEEQPLGPRRV
jgi:hypothetical protein